ncbi:MAG TPA: acetolactate decarboxylase [Flavisolibacter sp.]|nr:acetolactate decarboxylase [Flavisolibacter sp.]
MFKLVVLLFTALVFATSVPEVKVAGAMRNIMMHGDLSAHVSLDTLNKSHLYGLGPVAGLKGELVIIAGNVYSSARDGKALSNQQNKISEAAMLVYSNVKKWKAVSVTAGVQDYAGLEQIVKQTAEKAGYDTDKPFAFRIEAAPQQTAFHVIHWKEGAEHTMDNHKQFAYTDSLKNKVVEMLGFYSTKHKSIFTHHTTNMHIHTLNKSTGVVGHLDGLQIRGSITLYLPEQ